MKEKRKWREEAWKKLHRENKAPAKENTSKPSIPLWKRIEATWRNCRRRKSWKRVAEENACETGCNNRNTAAKTKPAAQKAAKKMKKWRMKRSEMIIGVIEKKISRENQ